MRLVDRMRAFFRRRKRVNRPRKVATASTYYSYTKRGSGRVHKSGKPREPFLGVAGEINDRWKISMDRRIRHMHKAARDRQEAVQ